MIYKDLIVEKSIVEDVNWRYKLFFDYMQKCQMKVLQAILYYTRWHQNTLCECSSWGM